MQQHRLKVYNFLAARMVIAQWRAVEALLVLVSQTSVGCRVTTVAMKDAVDTANAVLPSKREVPVKLSRVPFSGHRTHSHLIRRRAVTRLRRRFEICKTNAQRRRSHFRFLGSSISDEWGPVPQISALYRPFDRGGNQKGDQVLLLLQLLWNWAGL